MANIHISCPLSEPVSSTVEVRDLLTKYNHKSTYWNRVNRYDDSMIENCDGVVFIIPDFGWSAALDSLPDGVLKELLTAQRLKKDLYIAYRVRDKSIHLYTAKVESGIFTAESGRVSANCSNKKDRAFEKYGITKELLHDFGLRGSVRDVEKFAAKIPLANLTLRKDRRVLLLLG